MFILDIQISKMVASGNTHIHMFEFVGLGLPSKTVGRSQNLALDVQQVRADMKDMMPHA